MSDRAKMSETETAAESILEMAAEAKREATEAQLFERIGRAYWADEAAREAWLAPNIINADTASVAAGVASAALHTAVADLRAFLAGGTDV